MFFLCGHCSLTESGIAGSAACLPEHVLLPLLLPRQLFGQLGFFGGLDAAHRGNEVARAFLVAFSALSAVSNLGACVLW